MQRHTTHRPLPPDTIARLRSMAEVCGVLRGWGRPDLADRLAYFASDADLDEGDVPVTLESARGFLAFFGAVESTEGVVSLTCSPEGWICADWRFPDDRLVALWFIDHEQVDYAARKSDGHFIDLSRDSALVHIRQIAKRLVDMQEWFIWFKESQTTARSALSST